MSDTLKTFVEEVLFFFQPVIAAAENLETLTDFMADFGYDVTPNGLKSDLDGLTPSLETTLSNAEDALSGQGDLLVRGGEVFQALKAFIDAAARQWGRDVADVTPEIFDYLVRHYLGIRFGPAIAVLEALGVIEEREVPVAESGRDLKYTSVRLNWSHPTATNCNALWPVCCAALHFPFGS